MIADQQQNDWENPGIVGINKLSSRASLSPFSNRETALKNERAQSPYFLSLNGAWKFQYYQKPAERPGNFFREDADVSPWADIIVPGNWVLQDFGVPIYTDVEYPFPNNPPFIPHENNPVGTYRRTLSLPQNWRGRRIILRFDGAKSGSITTISTGHDG